MEYSFLTILTVNILSFSAGTAISWSSPVLGKLTNNGINNPFGFGITEEEASWISALLTLGSATGPLLFGNLTDRIGRKYTLLGIGIPIFIGQLLMSLSRSVISYYIGRFLCGLTLGGVFNVIPVYTAEVANSQNRGVLSSMLNLFLCAGSLFSYCLGPFVSVVTFNLILSVFPSIYLISFFIIGPESAYYNLQKGKYDLAKRSLQKVRGESIEVEEELRMMQKSVIESGRGNFSNILRNKMLRKALFVTLGLMVFQSLSGAYAVVCYTEFIFKQAGVNLEPEICSIIVGIVQFATTFITPLVIDRLGRKPIFLLSSVGMIISEAPLGIYCYLKNHNQDVSYIASLPIICLIVFTVSYNFGFGPLPWTIMSELFPTSVKSSAALFITCFVWSMSFVMAKLFPTVVLNLGMGLPFWIFAISCALAIPFTHFVLIETKGKHLQEIQDELAK